MYYMIVQTPFYFDFSAPYKLFGNARETPELRYTARAVSSIGR
jgi:hypothetical protein